MWLDLRFMFNSLQYGVKHQLLGNRSTDSCLTVLEGRTKENQDRIILSGGKSSWNIDTYSCKFSVCWLWSHYEVFRDSISIWSAIKWSLPMREFIFPKKPIILEIAIVLYPSLAELYFNQCRVFKCFPTCAMSWSGGYFNQKQTFN